MPTELKYIAQQAQDDFTQDYTGNTSFFTLQDWVARCGAVLAEYYVAEFKAKYAEYRQEKREEVIAFSTDILSTQELEVEKKDNDFFAKIKNKPFSFAYDNQNTGFQNVFVIEPRPEFEAQRTSINEKWMMGYVGDVNTIFWYPEGDKIKFIKTGSCNVKRVKLFYVPSIEENMMVPDGIQNYVRGKAVEQMKAAANQIIKETNDGNKNMTMETEVNKSQFKII